MVAAACFEPKRSTAEVAAHVLCLQTTLAACSSSERSTAADRICRAGRSVRSSCLALRTAPYPRRCGTISVALHPPARAFARPPPPRLACAPPRALPAASARSIPFHRSPPRVRRASTRRLRSAHVLSPLIRTTQTIVQGGGRCSAAASVHKGRAAVSIQEANVRRACFANEYEINQRIFAAAPNCGSSIVQGFWRCALP